MAQFEFVATHGVVFSDESGEWAKFERAYDLDTADAQKRYRFVTDEADAAARVRKVEGYGITEVSEPEPASRRGRPRKDVGDGDS